MLQMLAFKSVVNLTVASSSLLFKKFIFFEYCLLNAGLNLQQGMPLFVLHSLRPVCTQQLGKEHMELCLLLSVLCRTMSQLFNLCFGNLHLN